MKPEQEEYTVHALMQLAKEKGKRQKSCSWTRSMCMPSYHGGKLKSFLKVTKAKHFLCFWTILYISCMIIPELNKDSNEPMIISSISDFSSLTLNIYLCDSLIKLGNVVKKRTLLLKKKSKWIWHQNRKLRRTLQNKVMLIATYLF